MLSQRLGSCASRLLIPYFLFEICVNLFVVITLHKRPLKSANVVVCIFSLVNHFTCYLGFGSMFVRLWEVGYLTLYIFLYMF